MKLKTDCFMVTWPAIYVCLNILHTHTPKKKYIKELWSGFRSKPAQYLMLFDRIFHLCMPTLMTLSCILSFCANTIDDQTSALAAMEHCVSDIRSWMHLDKLKLNNKKLNRYSLAHVNS